MQMPHSIQENERKKEFQLRKHKKYEDMQKYINVFCSAEATRVCRIRNAQICILKNCLFVVFHLSFSHGVKDRIR